MDWRLPLLCCVVSVALPRAVGAGEALPPGRSDAAARRIFERSDRVIVAGFRLVFQGAGQRLAGFRTADLQRVTDEAYVDFRRQLERAGVTLLDGAVLKQSRHYGELMAARSGSVPLGGFSPRELPLFPDFVGGSEPGVVAPGSRRALNELSVETKAAVLIPTITIELGVAAPGGGPRAAVVPEATGIAVVHARVRMAGDVAHFHPDLGSTAVGGGSDDDYRRLVLATVQRFSRAAGEFIAGR